MEFLTYVAARLAQRAMFRGAFKYLSRRMKKPFKSAKKFMFTSFIKSKISINAITSLVMMGITSLAMGGLTTVVTTLAKVQTVAWKTIVTVGVNQIRPIVAMMMSPFAAYVSAVVGWAVRLYSARTSRYFGHVFILAFGSLACLWAYGSQVTPAYIYRTIINIWICRVVDVFKEGVIYLFSTYWKAAKKIAEPQTSTSRRTTLRDVAGDQTRKKWKVKFETADDSQDVDAAIKLMNNSTDSVNT